MCEAHDGHDENDLTFARLAKSAALCARLVCRVSCESAHLRLLERTEIVVNLTYTICLCPAPPLEIVLALANLSHDAACGQQIVAARAHGLLLLQFERVRDVRFAKVFGNLAALRGGGGFDAARAFAARFIQIAHEARDDPEMVNECLLVVAGAPAACFGAEQARFLLQLAFSVLNSTEMRLDASITAVGCLAALLAHPPHAASLEAAEEFEHLPELLLRQLAEAVDYAGSLQGGGLFSVLFGPVSGS